MTVADPDLVLERRLLREGASMVIGVDEVGRGAIAGPVAIGVSVLTVPRRTLPPGLRDSKMLSEKRREELQPQVAEWSASWAVGLASNEEVDRIGIIAALGLAGARALESLATGGLDVSGAVLVLDGSHDYLTPAIGATASRVRVTTRVKADRDCGTVAAASVLAKVHRDRLMIAAHDRLPEYRWVDNKGYASAEHYAAVDRIGPSDLHRWSWLRQPSLLDGLEEPA
jgi:ribonuclease HII